MTDEKKEAKAENNDELKGFRELVEKEPVQTRHSMTLNGAELAYTATAGMMPLHNPETGELEAGLFHVSYILDGIEDTSDRPLIFVFNGGPGSASIWLHLGAVGPRRVRMQDEGFMPAPPYRLEENPATWLDLADLVFIDPVGTGYSRALKKDLNKKYWNLKGDIESVGEFIRLFLNRSKRWDSPLFLAGESYGTTRAAGLAGHLVDQGIGLNGIVLISTILNFQTARFTRGNDLPYIVFLPTYTAAAWYHGRLPEDLQGRPLEDILAEVEEWAETDYTLALAKGDRLPEEERQTCIKTLSRYTGLSENYVNLANLRIHIMRFCKELLRDEGRTVGRLDSRFKGIDAEGVSEVPDFDPSMIAITPPYTTLLNQYVRSELGFETDIKYEPLSFSVNKDWEWDRGTFPDTSEALRSGLSKNPFVRVMVAQGYYDLATPHFAINYTLNHMALDPALRENFKTTFYHAGHMLYLDVGQLGRLKEDVKDFIVFSLGD
nr:peptidase S10 [Anaerolineae bacterium]